MILPVCVHLPLFIEPLLVLSLGSLPLLPDDVSLASLGHDLLDDVVHTEARD